jgi:ABC-2 type transport system ATP-binding protein
MVKVQIKNLSKTYKEKSGKNKPALNKVTIDSDVNGILTVIGRNGAGKTTIVRIMSTTLMLTSGRVFIDGIDIIKNPEKIRRRIAVIPQKIRLVPWMTALQNATNYLLWRGFSYSEAVLRAKSVFKELKIEKYMNRLPNALSGGTERKTLVGLALSSEADIIFLDEPTTGLDPVSRKELWDILKRIKKDHLIILTTHYLEEAEELSDKIAVLDEGKLIAFGTIEDLRKKIGYPYAIKVFSKDYKIKKIRGKLVKKDDGTMQIFSSEKEADRLASEFIKNRVKFSINPTSLEDIFYMLVGDINQEESNEKERS